MRSDVARDATGADPMGAVAIHTTRRIEWFHPPAKGVFLNSQVRFERGLDLPAPPAAIQVGPGKGLTILLDPAGQMLYRETASGHLYMLDLTGGITAMHGRETIFAVSRRESDQVLILEDRRT